MQYYQIKNLVVVLSPYFLIKIFIIYEKK